MDFLNKLSAKAGETFQTIKESDATKNAKNYAEIPGLSLQVGKQEGIVKKAYQEIGEAYYLAHKDDVDSIYGEQLQPITKALAKIEALKTEIENKQKDPSDAAKNVAEPHEAEGAAVVPSTVVEPEVAETTEDIKNKLDITNRSHIK